MNRFLASEFYTFAGIIQTFNSTYFYCNNNRRMYIQYDNILSFPVCVLFSIISGMTWPISLPIQSYFNNKWNKYD